MMFIIKLKITQLFRYIGEWISQLLGFVWKYIAAKVKRVVHSKPFIGILMLTIGITWTWVITFSNFEGKSLMHFVQENIASFANKVSKNFSSRDMVYTNPQPVMKVAEKKMEAEAVVPQGDIPGMVVRVAKEEGIDWKILYAICVEEGRGCTSTNEVGDNGCSIGLFQFNLCARVGITREQALDPEWSARKTAQELITNAGKGGWDYAIRRHNGNADKNFGPWKNSYEMTARYLARVKNNIETL